MLPSRITKRVNLNNLSQSNPDVGTMVEVVDELTPNYEVDEGFVEICPTTGNHVLVVTFYREAHWPVK